MTQFEALLRHRPAPHDSWEKWTSTKTGEKIESSVILKKLTQSSFISGRAELVKRNVAVRPRRSHSSTHKSQKGPQKSCRLNNCYVKAIGKRGSMQYVSRTAHSRKPISISCQLFHVFVLCFFVAIIVCQKQLWGSTSRRSEAGEKSSFWASTTSERGGWAPGQLKVRFITFHPFT